MNLINAVQRFRALAFPANPTRPRPAPTRHHSPLPTLNQEFDAPAFDQELLNETHFGHHSNSEDRAMQVLEPERGNLTDGLEDQGGMMGSPVHSA